MTGAGIAIILGLCLLFFAWQQRHQFDRGRRRSSSTTSRIIRPQHRQLERKLVKLLGGNRNTANRLIQQSQLRYPDKSADWHWEKAIYDLERDRWR
jgi:hypothetical protein